MVGDWPEDEVRAFLARIKREDANRPPKPKRPIRIEGNIGYVPLTCGFEALIDARDAEYVGRLNWHFARNHTGYAGGVQQDSDGYWRHITMHRYILKLTDPAQTVDHINGDGFDNRRRNLRVVTQAENARNKHLMHPRVPYRGVIQETGGSTRFAARIYRDGRVRRIGTFATAEEAARAYDETARAARGERAILNFPRQMAK